MTGHPYSQPQQVLEYLFYSVFSLLCRCNSCCCSSRGTTPLRLLLFLDIINRSAVASAVAMAVLVAQAASRSSSRSSSAPWSWPVVAGRQKPQPPLPAAVIITADTAHTSMSGFATTNRGRGSNATTSGTTRADMPAHSPTASTRRTGTGAQGNGDRGTTRSVVSNGL